MQGSTEVRGSRFFEAGSVIRVEIEFEVSADTMFKGLRYGILEPQFLDPISEAVTLASASDACILMVGPTMTGKPKATIETP